MVGTLPVIVRLPNDGIGLTLTVPPVIDMLATLIDTSIDTVGIEPVNASATVVVD